MIKRIVYIEGASEIDNGSLRNAFSKLFRKELQGNMPRIVMGDGLQQTIDKFLTKPLAPDEKRFLQIDSDQAITSETKDGFLQKIRISKNHKCLLEITINNTFLMVQEAEAWILSQPDVLERNRISTTLLPKCSADEISKPSEILAKLYKRSNKRYHKVSEFSKLLPMLDTVKLKEHSEEFRQLIAKLKNNNNVSLRSKV